MEDCKDCQAEASEIQVNCCLKAAKEGRMWGWKPPRKEWEERSGLVLTERSPLPGAAAEASTPTVGVGASALSRTGLALIGVVRCVGLNTVFEE